MTQTTEIHPLYQRPNETDQQFLDRNKSSNKTRSEMLDLDAIAGMYGWLHYRSEILRIQIINDTEEKQKMDALINRLTSIQEKVASHE